MLPVILGALVWLPRIIYAMELTAVLPQAFPSPYNQPLPLPAEWMLDASIDARSKGQEYSIWVAQGSKSLPADFDGMHIKFGQLYIEMFMNDRSNDNNGKLDPAGSCQWVANQPLRLKLEQHSSQLKLSTQQRSEPWKECFRLEGVALPAGYAISLDGKVPRISELDIWHITRDPTPPPSPPAENNEKVLAYLQQLSAKLDVASTSSGNGASADNSILEARLSGIESKLTNIDTSRGQEIREMSFIKDKLDAIKVLSPFQ